MSKIQFIKLAVHAETIAVAVAETGGEIRSHGLIPNRLESIRKMIHKLGPVGQLKASMKRSDGVCSLLAVDAIGRVLRGDRPQSDSN